MRFPMEICSALSAVVDQLAEEASSAAYLVAVVDRCYIHVWLGTRVGQPHSVYQRAVAEEDQTDFCLHEIVHCRGYTRNRLHLFRGAQL